ncbi:MAG: GntR family transcriptional regulator, partial [Chitinivibrionales bacterium]|nr:GntR family transcriptional regulator [Chitinivibrionales bacterium]
MRTPSERLREWLEARIDEASPGTRMPTAAQCGRDFGLSVPTVLKVLGEYQRRGRLVSIRGKGTFVAPLPRAGAHTGPPPAQSSVDSLYGYLTDLIARGVLKLGEPLPQVKALSAQCAVAPATVTRAYRRLVAAGVATKVGKSYQVGSFRQVVGGGSGKPVLLFCGDDTGRRSLFTTDDLSPTYLAMQDELTRRGYRLGYLEDGALPGLAESWVRGSASPPYALVFHRMTRERYAVIGPHLARLCSVLRRRTLSLPVVIDWERSNLVESPPRCLDFQRGHVTTAAARGLA